MKSISSCRCAFIVILMQLLLISYLQYTLHVTLKTHRTNLHQTAKSPQVFNDLTIPHEAVDVVFTWVNGSDPMFLAQLHKFNKNTQVKDDIDGRRRFADKNELKYALRSIEQNMPWINHVFIVTNGQVPNWLNLDTGQVTVVPHETIFIDKTALPTFNSHAIEANLHRIANLSKRFLYFNDDWLIGAPVDYSTFYTPADGVRFYLDYVVPPCANMCPWANVNNGVCDLRCYVPECDMDGMDCLKPPLVLPFMLLKSKSRFKDMFLSSIQHTHRFLNRHFGYEERNVMPHMPLLINKEVMAEAWKDFGDELMNTSAHRFRNASDLQFEIFYVYYTHYKSVTLPLKTVLKKQDSNKDGFLDSIEFQTVVARHFKEQPTEEQTKDFFNVFLDCSTENKTNFDALSSDNSQLKLEIKLLSDCHCLEQILRRTLKKWPKYKHVLLPIVQGGYFHKFKSLVSDYKKVVLGFNDLRRRPRKFICLNDDLTFEPKMEKVNRRIYEELANYYESMFPFASKYELPQGTRNYFDYIQDKSKGLFVDEQIAEELKSGQSIETTSQSKGKRFILVIVSIALFVLLVYLFFRSRKRKLLMKFSSRLMSNNNSWKV